MKILLDTQVFIWIIDRDKRLGSKSKKIVTSTANELYISYLSFFEMAIKASLGKLNIDLAVMDDLEKMGIVLLSGDQTDLLKYQIYNQTNKDPFDNFLIATAKSRKLLLLSSDRSILNTQVRGLELLDARK